MTSPFAVLYVCITGFDTKTPFTSSVTTLLDLIILIVSSVNSPDTELGIVMTLFCPTPTSKHQSEPSGRRFNNPSGSTPMILEYWGLIANLISMAKSELKFSSMPLMVKEDDLLT
ncbi:MAG: hypothetical protein PX483_07825 [Nostocales cyanobacterium LE14-WE4]|nr:hypothetical protein [Anabaena sp. 49633_E8]MCE2702886.1 hypothetical protein [Anabaena sp. 49633_E8]MDJ0500751.1 hypothetical protein [Nostocales cyanobacterium LE14-WE4]